MPSSCATALVGSIGAVASYNASGLFEQRYQDSPKEDQERLKKCWGYLDCGDCHRSKGHCGWCAIVRCLFLFRVLMASRVHPVVAPGRTPVNQSTLMAGPYILNSIFRTWQSLA